MEIKTGEQIWDEIECIDGRDSLCEKKWVTVDEIYDLLDKIHENSLGNVEVTDLILKFNKFVVHFNQR